MELEAELQAMCEIEQLNAQKTELTNLMRDNRKMILEYNVTTSQAYLVNLPSLTSLNSRMKSGR